jgi:hypothetical protein
MSEIMKTETADARLGDVQDSFPLGREFLRQGCSCVIGPASLHGVVVDDGEDAEHSCFDE